MRVNETSMGLIEFILYLVANVPIFWIAMVLGAFLVGNINLNIGYKDVQITKIVIHHIDNKTGESHVSEFEIIKKEGEQ